MARRDIQTSRVDANGRISLPIAMRKRLKIRTGDVVVVRLEDDSIRVLNPKRALERAQRLVRERTPADRNLVDELLAERRAEAERE